MPGNRMNISGRNLACPDSKLLRLTLPKNACVLAHRRTLVQDASNIILMVGNEDFSKNTVIQV